MKVGIILVGDELLAGAVADANLPFLARKLSERGTEVAEAAVVSDRVAEIAARVTDFCARFDLVVTTGGIGPTHDDRTAQGVALALGRALALNPDLHRIATARMGRDDETVRKLATVPEGARLWPGGAIAWPLLQVGKVLLLPGVPPLVEALWPTLEQFVEPAPLVVREVRRCCKEIDLAAAAARTQELFPAVRIGSYPISTPDGSHVLLRFTARDEAVVEEAAAAFERALLEPE